MADVARRAGVSTASVSRVLNDPEQVSAKLRERVEAAVSKLRYVRDGAARALAARRSRTIGAIVPTLGVGIFAAGVEALQRRLDQLGHSLLVASSQFDPDVELRQARALLERGVDGIALVGHRHRAELLRLLAETHTPYVFTYTYAGGRQPCVGFDHGVAIGRAVDLLVELGHRRFGIITSPTRDNDRITQRLEGARARIAKLKLPKPVVIEAPYGVSDGRGALRALLHEAPATTAVVCTTDVHAMGVLAEARALGIEVPARDIGERAADMLVTQATGGPAGSHVAIPVTLTVRGSTGRAPGK
jgi:LacI family transcriptional regulator